MCSFPTIRSRRLTAGIDSLSSTVAEIYEQLQTAGKTDDGGNRPHYGESIRLATEPAWKVDERNSLASSNLALSAKINFGRFIRQLATELLC